MREINLLYGVPLSANISETIVKTQLKTEFAQKGIDVNEIYISFTKKNVATMLSDNDKAIDVAVIAEFLERDGMKDSEISSLLEINEDIVIIPIIEAKHKGDVFLKNLFANGVYNCIRNDENNIIDMIVSLIHAPRKLSKAREYYGLSKNEDFSSVLSTATDTPVTAKGFKKDKKKKGQEDVGVVPTTVSLPSPSEKQKEDVQEIRQEENVIKVKRKSVQENLIIADCEEEKAESKESSLGSGEGPKKQEPVKNVNTNTITISDSSGGNMILASRKISKAERTKEKVFLVLKILVFVLFFLSITFNIVLLSDETIRDILSYTFFGGARM